MYVVTDDPENTNELFQNKSDFYENLGELSADYVEDSGDIATQADFFLRIMKSYGCEAGISESLTDYNGEPSRWFVLTEEARRNYFEKKFTCAREEMDKLTLYDFIRSDPWALRHDLYDNYGDLICYEDNGYQILDNAMRDMECGKKYYVTNAILVH